jgi:hypothetical protein
MELTAHFSLEELCTTSNKAFASQNLKEAKENLPYMEYLALFAEQIRAFIKVPMIITSGYRCDVLNRAVGGSKSSQHRFFRAIDFIPKGMDIEECFVKLKSSPLIYQQLIKEQSGDSVWVHVGMGDKRENLIYKDGKYIKI